MSGYHPDWIDIDKYIRINKTVKQVADYYFTSDGYDGDELVVQFTDGSESSEIRNMSPADENDLYISELKKLVHIRAKRQADLEYENFLQELKKKRIGFKRLAKLYLKMLKEKENGIPHTASIQE